MKNDEGWQAAAEDELHPTQSNEDDLGRSQFTPPSHRGIPLGSSPTLPDPRSGSGLQRCRHPPIAGHVITFAQWAETVRAVRDRQIGKR